MEYALIDELAGMFGKPADRLNAAAKRPSEYAVVDEAQDLSVNEGLLGALTGKKPKGLFASVLGQQFLSSPFPGMRCRRGFDQRSRNMRVSWSITGLKR
jgi:hypothetical protein